MKKFIKVGLLAVLSAVLCVCMAACGDNPAGTETYTFEAAPVGRAVWAVSVPT